ncbi:carbon-nitrogen hydrolase family protein [Hyphomicrobium sp.]|uniref:carbon-nitrogen hydrolase family protein n=1 Tax=Hyphomicrobium sp. TaxID=82 RepID=UPI001D41D77D|nr:carbon-nitrogen hydrolase family protein [Hyphomicrobium sp.]MBY0559311.1 carbon-nitrogen hydrolase family protein [Hyphomicrobium sp.]
MTAKHLKVASSQYPIGQPKTLAEWEKKIALWVKNGAATGAELLVFPEYAAIEQAACFGPEIYEDLQATLTKVAELKESRVQFHLELAAKHNVHILVGSGPTKKIDGRFVNAAQLVTPKGSVGEQEKLVMTPFEHGWGVTAGGPVRVFSTSLGTIGIAICYDSEFPLITRAMAEAGAEVLLVPSCTERVSGYHRVRTGSMARALENTIAAVQSPTVGDAPWSPAVDFNAGAAGVYVPSEHGVSDTGVLAEGTLNAAEWVTASIDLTRLARVRETGEMHNYGDWLKQPGGGTTAKVAVEVVKLI